MALRGLPLQFGMFSIPLPASESALAQRLSRAAGLPVQLVASIDSTNTALLSAAADLPLHPQAACGLVALSQTAGRGRRGRGWSTASGQSHSQAQAPAFIASLGVRTAAALPLLGLLPLHIGVAVASQLRQWGCAAQLKWPNDLVLDTAQGSAKLGGILVETRSVQGQPEIVAVVMGMGLNWHSAPALADRLTDCVAPYAINAPDPTQACAALLAAMQLGWERTMAGAACEFAPFDALHGQMLSWHSSPDQAQQGRAQGINALGHLAVQTTSGLQWLHSGEVSVKVAQ